MILSFASLSISIKILFKYEIKIFPFDGSSSYKHIIHNVWNFWCNFDERQFFFVPIFFVICWSRVWWLGGAKIFLFIFVWVQEQFVHDIRHGFMPKFWLTLNRKKNLETALTHASAGMIDGQNGNDASFKLRWRALFNICYLLIKQLPSCQGN